MPANFSAFVRYAICRVELCRWETAGHEVERILIAVPMLELG